MDVIQRLIAQHKNTTLVCVLVCLIHNVIFGHICKPNSSYVQYILELLILCILFSNYIVWLNCSWWSRQQPWQPENPGKTLQDSTRNVQSKEAKQSCCNPFIRPGVPVQKKLHWLKCFKGARQTNKTFASIPLLQRTGPCGYNEAFFSPM